MTSSPSFDLIDDLERRAIRHATASGEGTMVWRMWPARRASGEPSLLLLHGGSGSWRHWVRNIDALGETRDVWVPDLPGFGELALPSGEIHFSSVASTLAEGLSRLLPADGRLDVAGFSFGSHTAQYLADRMGARVRGIVLVTGHMLGPMLARPDQFLERWRDVTDRVQRERILKHNLGALMLAHEASMDLMALEIYASDVVRSRVRPALFINKRDFTLVERLGCRIAGIAGALDPLGVPSAAAQGEALLKARPDAEFHLVPDVGHWVCYEAADTFNTLLAGVLDRFGTPVPASRHK